jgi:DNA invertase Pin-like site-specific DNA recombinase
VQRERIEASAKAGGHTIADVLVDLDQPGSKYARPRFQEALERVEAGEADGIIVAALDRFARSVPDAAVALRRLEDAGAVLISVRDALDTSTPVGRFARTMMLALAELELDRIRENWATARGHAISRGVHISRVPPLGYRRGSDGRLEPNPETAPVVRELFHRRAAGAPWRELASFLDERLPRDSGGAWPVGTVTSIVSRRVYLGEAAAGVLVNPTAHAPLVSRAEWEAAQAAPKSARTPRRADGGALLVGIIRCAGCGQPMTREGSGKRGTWTNYGCQGRHAGGVCPAPTKISTARADEYVEGAFLEWIARERVALEATTATNDLDRMVAQLEAAETELAAYRDANLVSVIGRDAYVAGLTERARAVEDARRGLQAQHETDVSELLRVDLVEAWPTLTTAERRTILTAAIDRITVRRGSRPGKGSPASERLAITWRAGDVELAA